MPHSREAAASAVTTGIFITTYFIGVIDFRNNNQVISVFVIKFGECFTTFSNNFKQRLGAYIQLIVCLL